MGNREEISRLRTTPPPGVRALAPRAPVVDSREETGLEIQTTNNEIQYSERKFTALRPQGARPILNVVTGVGASKMGP